MAQSHLSAGFIKCVVERKVNFLKEIHHATVLLRRF